MYNPMHRPPRPRLTGPIIGYALLDVFGLSCVALGASWFASGKGAIIASFPTSTAEAVASLGGGVAVMLWAVSRILRELARQQPEMQARYAEWMAKHHPDKVASLRPADDQTNDRADN
jgi:hypothetical protein